MQQLAGTRLNTIIVPIRFATLCFVTTAPLVLVRSASHETKRHSVTRELASVVAVIEVGT